MNMPMFKKPKLGEKNGEESEKLESDGEKLVETIMLRKLKGKLLQRRLEATKSLSPKSWVSIPDLPKTSLIPDDERFPIGNDNNIDVEAPKPDSDGYVPLPKPDYSWYTKRESVKSVKDSIEIISIVSEDDFDDFNDSELKFINSSIGDRSASNFEVIDISDDSSCSEDVIPPSPVNKKNVTDGIENKYLKEVSAALEQPSSSRNTRSQCPVCLEEFPLSMQQIDIDAHIAQCLQQSTEDLEW